MAGNIELKRGILELSAELDGEPANESVFVDGRKVGETPFRGALAVCSEIEIGSGREAVDARLKYNEVVKRTHVMGGLAKDGNFFDRNSFWIALGLDVLGVIAIRTGMWLNGEAENYHRNYMELKGGSAEDYASAQKEVENAVEGRNFVYLLGSALLAAGIVVHIWF